ncbi:PDZ domain-containing protein [Marinomonas atlantica]|uniref:PDZ domain-containing protein n=1 Tax=Marinomonas atlantica TaxID=1806668 RepID=UPI00082F4829|nr:PDZ domain-containing protein [Marinomonas atlantica]
MKAIFIATVAAFLLTGCAQNSYKKFYNPYVDAKTLPDVELVAEGQEPQVLSSGNLERDVLDLRSKKYIPIGHSSFNGVYEDAKNAAAQAKSIGATLVLVNSQYTNTETTTSTLYLPDNKTTFHSGSINGSASYSGTSTTYGSTATPITSNHRRYDQEAVYFVKSNQKHKFGLQFGDLTSAQSAQYERNTGVLVYVVIEDSPAFYSNVLSGDVLIAVDGVTVKDTNHAIEIMNSIPPSQDHSVLRVIRNGQEKDIQVKL